MHKMTFEILISTMYRSDITFLDTMFPNEDKSDYSILIINQTDNERHITKFPSNVRVINTQERGLSKSRNMAIKNAIGDICLVADDDVKYVKDVGNIITSAFAKAKNAAVITFKMVNTSGKMYQDYPLIRNHTQKSLYTVNGVVISFDRKQLLEKEVFYNDHFGLGATFETADEYVFMKNVLKSGMEAVFEPVIILSHPDISSGSYLESDSVVYGRAALKYKEYGVFAYIWILKYIRFLVVHKYISMNQVKQKLKIGLLGIKKYRSLLKSGAETR